MTVKGFLWALVDERAWRYITGWTVGYAAGAHLSNWWWAAWLPLIIIGSIIGPRDVKSGKRLN